MRDSIVLRGLVAILIVLIPSSIAFAADCAPEKMVRIVFREATPGIDPRSFAAQPKTLYRLGLTQGRLEEVPDRERRIHGLIVVNERDVWIVNRFDRSGQHVVDPGPTFALRAPVLGGEDVPPPLLELEFGCELAFIEARAPKAGGQLDLGGGVVLDQHRYTHGDHGVAVLVRPEDRRVFGVAYYQRGALRRLILYVEYELGLEPNPALFARPEGIGFVEGDGRVGP